MRKFVRHLPTITKFSFLISLCLFPLIGTAAEPLEVQKFEGELYVGFTEPMGSWHGSKSMTGIAIGGELRYNIPESPWDMGFHIGATTAVHKIEGPTYTHPMEQSNRSVNYLLVGDYNFRQGRKVNPFIGAGVGINFYEPVEDKVYDVSGTGFTFAPRAGVELFRHLRLSVVCNITRAGFNNIEFRIGGVIGGRPKR